MGLTGIQILQKLPKTNCKECGLATCMAFAMKVAAGQAEIDACPHIDPAAKEEIAEASAPPVRVVKLGNKECEYKLGGDTVLFRHEKKFEHPSLLGTKISSDMDGAEVKRRINSYKVFKWDRVGIELKPEVVFLEDKGGDFAGLVQKVRTELPEVAIILRSQGENLSKAVDVCADFKPLLYAASPKNWEEMVSLAQEKKLPLVVAGDNLGETAKLSKQILDKGLKELVLDLGSQHPKELMEDLIIARRAAIKNKFKPLGFPMIVFTERYADSLFLEAMLAGYAICKYASIIILSDLRGDILVNLLIENMNIYTDPQKPLVVEQGIYPLNGPDEYSPVMVTCNFALTYFIVSGEVEASGVPVWMLIKDTDGLSVLTAWAAGKFGADNIAEFIKKSGIADKVKHRKLIIPGYVAGIKGELEEELPDWEIVVGTREASGLPPFLKDFAQKLRAEAGGGVLEPAQAQSKTEEQASSAPEQVTSTQATESKPAEPRITGGEEVKAMTQGDLPTTPDPRPGGVITIAESINVMSKTIGAAMKARDAKPIQEMAIEETKLGADYLDLNIGPAKKDGADFAAWVVKVVEEVVDTPISLDTTNPEAMIGGVRVSKNPKALLMNSISIQKSRLEKLGPLAAELGCNAVALLWGESGLPRDANERAALVVDLVGKLNEYGIPNEKLWVDPILTPITLGADQILEILNFLSMLQDIVPGVKTTIGLSNVSNGVPAELRPYLNRAMLMILMKYGQYSAIVDIYDQELVEIAQGKHPDWVEMVSKMVDGDEPNPKELSPKELEIYKTVRVLTGKTIFSESWLEL